MRLIVDANVVLRNVLGTGRSVARAIEAGAQLMIPEAQIAEAAIVLVRKFAVGTALAHELIDDVAREIEIVDMPWLHTAEVVARRRLGPRGQSDWPVVAAALLLEADIWSNDRDFFGVGVAVWSNATIGIACGETA